MKNSDVVRIGKELEEKIRQIQKHYKEKAGTDISFVSASRILDKKINLAGGLVLE